MPGSPATSPYLGLPRYAQSDAATFAPDVNAVVDALDTTVIRADDARLMLMTSGLIASRPVSTVGSPGRLGRIYISTDEAGGDRIYLDLGTRWLLLNSEAAIVQDPSGTVNAFAGASAPTGWLLCDGSAVSRTTYASLFAVVGTTFGAGDGSTTFNVPDLRSRFVLGRGGGGTGSTLGSTGGALDHTHSIPGLSVAGLSIPALTIPGLAVPALSIPALSIPALACAVSVPNLTLFASTGGHQHTLGQAGGVQANFNSASSNLIEWGQSATPTYGAGFGSNPSVYPASVTSGVSATRQGIALYGFTDSGTASVSGVAVGTSASGFTTGSNTGSGTTGTGTTGTGSTGTGTTGSGTTGTGTTGANNPPFMALNYIIKV